MNTRERTHPSPDGFGSIHANEILPLREVARRLGWGQKTIRSAQKAGLRAIEFGRLKYCLGVDVIEWFDSLDGDD
ncbi:hypothetical protein LCGC14_0772270 [marine sediment metagenome]|uniref:Uncharacterized protein n=1 Tax=marine sediment metagenome TaxID=412755 RepID=A0A0F9T4R6_9ZZZZ